MRGEGLSSRKKSCPHFNSLTKNPTCIGLKTHVSALIVRRLTAWAMAHPPNILLSALSQKILHLCPALNVRGQILHSCNTADGTFCASYCMSLCFYMTDKKTKEVVNLVYQGLVLYCICAPEKVGENKKKT
jgi:hypothetical protein